MPPLALGLSGPIFGYSLSQTIALGVRYSFPVFLGGGGRDAKVFMDGKYVVDLPAGGYTFVYIEPGKHEIMQQWHDWSLLDNPAMRRALGIVVNVAAGETRYVRFEAATSPKDINQYWFEWVLTNIPDAIGRQEIEQQHFVGVPRTK